MYIKEGYLIFFIDNYNSHKAVYRSSTCDIILLLIHVGTED